jgi:hypothetical protein
VKSAFTEDMHKLAYPIEYQLTVCVSRIAGGIPSDRNVTESWIRTKLGDRAEDLIQEAVAEAIVERGLDQPDPETGKVPEVNRDEIIAEVALHKHLNGFKRVAGLGSQLMIEGRQLKAALKEAASAAVGAAKLNGRGWGETRKGLLSFLAEHVFIVEMDLPLFKPLVIEGGDVDEAGNKVDAYDFVNLIPVNEPDGINQRFVHTWRGSGISLEEYVDNAVVVARVLTDFPFTAKDWAMILLTGERQGLGASRSQGYGQYTVVGWDLVRDNRPAEARRKAPVKATGGDE